jgi:hypothetical protein
MNKFEKEIIIKVNFYFLFINLFIYIIQSLVINCDICYCSTVEVIVIQK